MLHTGKSADYVNLALKNGAVSLVINLGSGAFEALVEPVNGKFNDNAWHDVKVTRNLRQVTAQRIREFLALFLTAAVCVVLENPNKHDIGLLRVAYKLAFSSSKMNLPAILEQGHI